MVRSLLILLSLTLFVSCKKEAGEGGKAEIHGRIMEQRYSSINQLPTGDPYPLLDQNVYIIYGDTTDGAYPDDNVDSGPDGKFRFQWLRKGSYTVYAISDCHPSDPNCQGERKTISIPLDIGDRKGVVEIGDLTVEKW
ncbi:MAG: hypothetical protein IPO87_04040 [Flavobacteriales bacterium]|nr:hypothetical protein [Flavobacteriales bacterium]